MNNFLKNGEDFQGTPIALEAQEVQAAWFFLLRGLQGIHQGIHQAITPNSQVTSIVPLSM